MGHRWLVLSLLTSLAASLPDITFILPEGGEIFKGGEVIRAAWQFSGNDTYVPATTKYDLYLCAGGVEHDTHEQLMPIIENAKLADDSHSASAMVPRHIGQDHDNAYFLQMIINPAGDATVIHSKRFGFMSLTGKFSNRISDILFHLHPTVTQAPPIPPSVGELLKRQVGAPYAKQTGKTKYAPVPKQPGTKITKKATKPLYPTSSYKIASVPLDDATIKTTISASATFSTKSIENTARAASQPTDGSVSGTKNKRGEEDEMLKILRRWAD
ncbi:hypothetical protein KEM54_000648 [Ascosphaera aggregata]|nr:hypothetical protein KEM54_000648 [Ascosphaera aggregata]